MCQQKFKIDQNSDEAVNEGKVWEITPVHSRTRLASEKEHGAKLLT